MSNSDFEYVEGSFAGPFDLSELEAFEKWLRKTESDRIRFDPSYVQHISKYHGGVPRKRHFQTTNGTQHVVERFLNFLPPDSVSKYAMYRVEGTWGMIEDRLSVYLVPFADLFAGDKLCFDYETGDRPKVVVWYHDQSDEGSPYTEVAANSFDEFLEKLSDAP